MTTEQRDRLRWERDADRAVWWRERPGWPYPTHVAFTRDATDAEWLAQAFREAVSKVHDYGTKEEPDPLTRLVQQAAIDDPTDDLARRAIEEVKPHIAVEDADDNCDHPFCVMWWPMVRAAEANARLAALATPPQSEPSLTFASFAETNRARCEAPDGFGHPLSGWSLSDWLLAATGEFGEAANVAKKLNRERDGIPGNTKSEAELRADLADEFADAVIYLDLAAQSQGIDLGSAIASKFNRTSEKIDAPHRLPAPRRGPDSDPVLPGGSRPVDGRRALDEAPDRRGTSAAAGASPPASAARTPSAPHPGQLSSARESASWPLAAPVCRAGVRDSKRGRRARAAHSLDTHSRPGAEPSGLTRTRTADGPRATSSDGDSPETEWAIAQATPGRTHDTSPSPG